MKIGIVTYWKSNDNYGQQLQCYALQKLLRSWGHYAYLIRYNPLKPKEKEKNILGKLWYFCLNPSALLWHFPIETAKKKAVNYENRLREINIKNNPIRRFQEFRNENLLMSKEVYESFDQLKNNPPEADVYITGSDQVWHDFFYEDSSKGWFLQFGCKETKRISYAASIGREVSREEIPFFCNFMKEFQAISVREETVQELCSKQGIVAQVCLDPTLLLPVNNYRGILKSIESDDKYAFLYVLNVKSSKDFFLDQLLSYFKEKELKIKSVTGSGYCQGRELIEGNKNILASIPEWLGYIEHASCVITTSYHGTVFSILMHRPFLTIGLQGKYGQGNSRMEQLLLKLGLQERMLNPQLPIAEQMDKFIDWDDVDIRLEQMRQSSLQFLRDNLE